MVDSPHRLAPAQPLHQSLVQHLHQLATHQLTSQTFVQWAETQHWQLLEGADKTDQTPVAQILREILSDILLQWEFLQANQHETAPAGQGLVVEFPAAWLTTWLNQLQSPPATTMSNINFNGTVGIVNTGNTTIHGDQIGIQTHYTFPDPKQTEATQAVADLLQDLRHHYPQASDAEILEIIQQGLETMRQQNPQKWQRWQGIFSVIFAGAVEGTKILVPVAGIPIEVLKRLYEIYQHNRKQLPSS